MDNFSPFYRQVLVAATSHLAALSVGAITAYPIVLLQQLPNEPNLALDLDSTSWIASVQGIAGALSIFMTPLMQWRGRRFAFTISVLIMIIGWTLITIAKDSVTIIIGESFHGLGSNSAVVVSLVTVSEMIDPKYRSLSMILFGVIQSAGSILVTVIGNFWHYKTISIIMCISSILSLMLSFMWTDSPSWLAYRGDFEKCEQIFIWLRGDDEDSKKELNAMISAQKILKEKTSERKTERKRNYAKKFFEKVSTKDFYLPMACLLLIMLTYYASGALVVFMYGPTLVQNMTGITNALIPTIGLDVALGISVILTIVMERYLKNKQIFLICGVSSTVFLLFFCVLTYLHCEGILAKDSMLFLYCFLGYIVSNAAGLTPTVFNVSAELIPVKHRGLGGAIYLICMSSFFTISVKTAPYLFIYMTVWGTFILYLISSAVGYFLIWKFIPETKQRTLQEIEDYFNYGEFNIVARDECTVNVPIIASE